MARDSVADRTTLVMFLAREIALRTVIRVTAVSSLALPSGKADRIVIAPQDLRTTDATRAAEMYSGRFAFAGKVVM
jgi:uncharacterized heparinase superfamily protein